MNNLSVDSAKPELEKAKLPEAKGFIESITSGSFCEAILPAVSSLVLGTAAALGFTAAKFLSDGHGIKHDSDRRAASEHKHQHARESKIDERGERLIEQLLHDGELEGRSEDRRRKQATEDCASDRNREPKEHIASTLEKEGQETHKSRREHIPLRAAQHDAHERSIESLISSTAGNASIEDTIQLLREEGKHIYSQDITEKIVEKIKKQRGLA